MLFAHAVHSPSLLLLVAAILAIWLLKPPSMLVLSRHRDESIIIGHDIVITVVDIRGDKVRLGIAAPIEISVHRQEVYEAIQRENRQSSRLEPSDARQIERVNQPTRRDMQRRTGANGRIELYDGTGLPIVDALRTDGRNGNQS